MSAGAALLSVHGLSFHYGATRVLDAVALDVHPGEWVCLYGPNGAGKSTLLHCIVGLARPGPGARVLHAGRALEDDPVAVRRATHFAVGPDDVPGELSPAQYLELVASAHGVVGPGRVASGLIEGFALGPHMHKRLSRCSLGTRQKAAIVAAFVGQPSLVVLDEPFNGLDAESLMAAKRIFSDFARTGAILMASHGIEIVAEWCSRIDHLAGGRIRDRIDLVDWRARGRSVRALEEQLLPRREPGADAQTTLRDTV